jgi:hypothetical protein
MTAHRTRRRRCGEDLAFVSYLGTLTTLLLIGGFGVLVLDLEGRTKLASAAAFLLPAAALIAVIVYALRMPLWKRPPVAPPSSRSSGQAEQAGDLGPELGERER